MGGWVAFMNTGSLADCAVHLCMGMRRRRRRNRRRKRDRWKWRRGGQQEEKEGKMSSVKMRKTCRPLHSQPIRHLIGNCIHSPLDT